LENGASWAGPAIAKRRSLHDRNPLLFWKMLCALQFIIIVLLVSLLTRQ
jgi:hypothetical protein